MRPTLFVLAVVLSTHVFGQSDLLSTQDITIHIDSAGRHFTVDQNINIKNKGKDTLYALPLEWWLPAWQNKKSGLAREFLYEQNTDLHFAESEERGSCSAVWIYHKAKSALFAPEEQMDFKLERPLEPGEDIDIRLRYDFDLPLRAFTGMGFEKGLFTFSHAIIRIADWHDGRTFYQEANIRQFAGDRADSIRYTIHNTAKLPLLVPGKGGIQRDSVVNGALRGSDLVLIGGRKLYQLEEEVDNTTAYFVFTGEVPALDASGTIQRIREYISSYYGDIMPDEITVLFTENTSHFPSYPTLIALESNSDFKECEAEMAAQFVKGLLTRELYVSNLAYPSTVLGLMHFHQYDYLEKHDPDRKLLGEYANSLAARFMDIDEVSPTYLHRWLYLYLARQGLDQPLSDSARKLSKLNIEAVAKGKSALALHILKGYAGDKNFRRGLHRWVETRRGKHNSPENMLSAVQYFANRDLSWYLGELYTTNKKADYSLRDVDQCSYLVLATVENRGDLAIPYSTLGYNESGEAIMEEWHDGHLDRSQQPLYLDTYRHVVIDPQNTSPDLDGQNNFRKVSGWFSGIEPIRLQFYTGLDQPGKTQIYWLPSLKYNAYDGVLAGLQFYNKTLLPKRWEYKVNPVYSTRTGSLTGLVSLHYLHPMKDGIFHAVEAGLYGRYFHYNEGLAYNRFSPSVNFHFRKSHPRSEIQYILKLRTVGVDREQAPEDAGLPAEVSNAQYWVGDIRLIRENQSILFPSQLEVDFQYAKRFSKASLSYLQRIMLPNRQWMDIRIAGGVFLRKNFPSGQHFFSFGMSGTQDYLFDYNFIGRSDSTGIWSQQFFVSDGGFKSTTNSFSDSWMSGLSVNLPVWKGFGLFGDVGYNASSQRWLWDYGLRLAIVPDFLEFYFPIQSNRDLFLTQANYAANIRFILNIDERDIIRRLRRGWY